MFKNPTMNPEFKSQVHGLNEFASSFSGEVVNLVGRVTSEETPIVSEKTFDDISLHINNLMKANEQLGQMLEGLEEKLKAVFSESSALHKAEENHQLGLLDSMIAEAEAKLDQMKTKRVIMAESLVADPASTGPVGVSVGVDYLHYKIIEECYVEVPASQSTHSFAYIDCERIVGVTGPGKDMRIIFVGNRLVIFHSNISLLTKCDAADWELDNNFLKEVPLSLMVSPHEGKYSGYNRIPDQTQFPKSLCMHRLLGNGPRWALRGNFSAPGYMRYAIYEFGLKLKSLDPCPRGLCSLKLVIDFDRFHSVPNFLTKHGDSNMQPKNIEYLVRIDADRFQKLVDLHKVF